MASIKATAESWGALVTEKAARNALREIMEAELPLPQLQKEADAAGAAACGGGGHALADVGAGGEAPGPYVFDLRQSSFRKKASGSAPSSAAADAEKRREIGRTAYWGWVQQVRPAA